MSERIAIGEFAKMCRLTVKALRHYDELGLLRPVAVDRKTGYRYYARAQAETALRIAMLRELDVPLPAIREVLEAPSRRGDVLARERARIERNVRRAEAALAALDLVIRAPTAHVVTMRDLPDIWVARVRGVTTSETHVDDTSALLASLLASLRDADVRHGDPMLAELPRGMGDDAFPIEVCVRVDGPLAAPFDATRLAFGPCAVVRHVGPYTTLGLAHFALYAFAAERGHPVGKPLREVYVSDPAHVPPSELVTDVVLPLGP